MLSEIEFMNVCQFEHINVKLPVGLTVVIGRQGAGKSNLFLNGLSSLTGEKVLEGEKALNIKHNAVGPSFIRTVWSRGGNEVEIVRGLKKMTSSLRVNGELRKDIRREPEITAAACELLGVNPKEVMEFSFVRQSQTGDVFKQLDTARVEFFLKMLGCAEMSTWTTKVNSALSYVNGVLSFSYLESINTLAIERNRLATEAVLAAQAVRDSEQLETYWQAEVAKYVNIIEEQNKFAVLKSSLLASRTKLRLLDANLVKFQAEKQRNITTAAIAAGYMDYSKRAAIANELNKQVIRATSKLQQLDDESARMGKELEEPVKPEDIELLRHTAEQLAAKKAILYEELDRVKLAGAVCPKCHQPVPQTDRTEADVVRDGKAVNQQIADTAELIRTETVKQQAWQRWDNTKAVLERRLVMIEAERKELESWLMSNKVTQVEPQDRPAVISVNATVDDMQRLIDSMHAGIGKLEAMAEAATADRVTLLADIEDLETQLSARQQPSQEVVDAAGRAQGELMAATIKKDAAKENQRRLEIKVAENRANGIQLIESYRKQKKFEEARMLLESVSPVVKATALPQAVLRGMVRALAYNMTQLCAELSQPFVITANDSLEFVATKPDGRAELAKRLSGGQQACLATVFWVSRLLAGDGPGLPLLVLDEPSANMEPEIIPQFASLLEKLNVVLIEQNKQVIVMTHHRQLVNCGSHKIELA